MWNLPLRHLHRFRSDWNRVMITMMMIITVTMMIIITVTMIDSDDHSHHDDHHHSHHDDDHHHSHHDGDHHIHHDDDDDVLHGGWRDSLANDLPAIRTAPPRQVARDTGLMILRVRLLLIILIIWPSWSTKRFEWYLKRSSWTTFSGNLTLAQLV